MDQHFRLAPNERHHWPDRRLLHLLRIETPLVQAPMIGIGTIQLAAAVCAAGGLGSIGCGAMSPDAASRVIQKLRALTTRPFNVNFFCHSPARVDDACETAWGDRLSSYYRELGLDQTAPVPRSDFSPFDDAMCSVVEQTRPEVVSFHFGLPEPSLLDRVKAAGCRVMSSATSVAEALWLERHGVDAVIAQGFEAGGHRAMFLGADSDILTSSQTSTLALVPQVVEAIRLPVIAAGGIADGRGIAAAFALGAAGAQMGTAYLRCPEATISPLHREALRHVTAEGTVVTNVFTGRPARAIANRLTREIGPMSATVPRFPLAMPALSPLRNEAERRGNGDFTAFWAGQGASMGLEMPAEPLTRRLADTALERLRWLGVPNDFAAGQDGVRLVAPSPWVDVP